MNSASVAEVVRATELCDARARAKRSIDAAVLLIASVALPVFGTTPAHADTTSRARFELDWRVPASCPDAESARRAIDEALGTNELAAPAPHSTTTIHVTISEQGSARWNADIWMYDAADSGERSISGTSCEQVVQATALVIALALAANPNSQPNIAPEPAAERETEHAQFGVGIGAAGDLGSLPQLDLGFALLLLVQSRTLRAEAELAGWLPRVAHDLPGGGSGGNFSLFTGGLRGCWDVLSAADGGGATLGPCASVELGATVGQGFGLAVQRTSWVFWGSGSLGFSARYLAAPLWLGMRVEAGLPWFRPAWQVDDVGTVFRPSRVIGRVSLSAGWLFL